MLSSEKASLDERSGDSSSNGAKHSIFEPPLITNFQTNQALAVEIFLGGIPPETTQPRWQVYCQFLKSCGLEEGASSG